MIKETQYLNHQTKWLEPYYEYWKGPDKISAARVNFVNWVILNNLSPTWHDDYDAALCDMIAHHERRMSE